ncbi:MAG: hypothetical protein JWL71_3409 [Acidobacteria bacterium]|nr:hypothetical protein [Acidobacteriota bacterium]
MTLGPLEPLVAQWATLFSNHAAVRTAVVFAHVGGLVGAGGCAVAADRATLLAAAGHDAERRHQVEALAGTHRVVVLGLVFIVVSGLLLFAADVDTFFSSRIFWIKMALILALLTNGVVLQSAERHASRGVGGAWGRLRATSMISLVLWFLVAFAGVALTNAG